MAKRKVIKQATTVRVSKQASAVQVSVPRSNGAKVSSGRAVRATPLTEKERASRKFVASAGGFNNRTANFYGSGDVSMGSGSNWYSPQLSTDFLEKPQNLRERRAWYRHFYNSTEIVGAGIDLHSTVPLSKIKLQKPKAKNAQLAEYSYRFFNRMVDRLDLLKTLSEMSHEYWLIGNCVLGDSLVRTPSGYVPIQDIEVGDLVLTHKGTYQETEVTMNFPDKEVLSFKVQGRSKPLSVTEEHPVEIYKDGRFTFVDAKDVKVGDFVKQVAPRDVEDVETVDYCTEGPITLTDKGYTRKTVIEHSRDKEALRVRSGLIDILTNLEEATILSRAGICETLKCSNYTLNNVLTTLDQECSVPFRGRIGAEGFGKGSKTEWFPLTEKIEANPKYAITREQEFEVPHKLNIDEDFMYLAGYWLGDGTLGRDNSRPDSWGRGIWYVCFGEGASDPQHARIKRILEEKLGPNCLTERRSKGMVYLHVKANPAFIEWWSSNFGDTCSGNTRKSIPEWVRRLPSNKVDALLAGMVDSDGSLLIQGANNTKYITISSSSASLIKDIWDTAVSSKILAYESSRDVTRNGTGVLEGRGPMGMCSGTITILGEESCSRIEKYLSKEYKHTTGYRAPKVVTDGEFYGYPVKSIELEENLHRVYNLQVAKEHTFVVDGHSTHNCFAYAEDHNPYEGLAQEAKGALLARGKAQSDMLLKNYRITDKDPNYIGWRKIIILPPDQVRVTRVPFADLPLVEYTPDPETKAAIQKYQESDGEAFKGLSEASRPAVPKAIHDKVSTNGSIPLEQDPSAGSFVYHLARKKSQYETMGVSILERCVNTLLVKDKLRQAQTSIASRHMTPTRVVSSDGLSEYDVEDLRAQVDMSLMDPDYSIIANYTIDWEEYGSNQRLLDLSAEFERYDSDLYAGLGVTKEMMTGEASYSGSKITLELLNIKYMLYRDMLQSYIEKKLFEPVARKKGFVETDRFGTENVIYPTVSFARLSIRDNDAVFDQLMQLYNKGSLPIEDIFDLLGIDAETAKVKLKKDLLTVNDAAFNDLIRGAYQAAGTEIPNQTDIMQKLAENMGLTMNPAGAGEEGGEADAGGGGGLRFASSKPKVNDPKAEFLKLAEEDPEGFKAAVALMSKRAATIKVKVKNGKG